MRAIPGFRDAAMFFGHPPGLHLIFAAFAKASGGASLTLAHLLVAVFSAIGVCATYLLARRSFEPLVAWTAALLLLLSPVYFAQSAMFLADLPVAALGALATFLALTRRFRAYVLCAACMTLIKETAAAVVLAIAIYKFIEARTEGRRGISELLRYSAPVAALAVFVLIQKAATGRFLWIYDFDVEFAKTGLDSVTRPFGLLNAWIFLNQNRVVFTALILLSLVFTSGARRRKELLLFVLLVIFSAWPFAFIYYLPRYLMPVLPVFCILTAASMYDLVRSRTLRLVSFGALLAFAGATLASQPLSGNGETSLRYLDIVQINKSAADIITQNYPRDTVVAVFPNASSFRVPVLGYVDASHPVKSFHDSSDVAGAGVIFVSSPSAPNGEDLRQLALRHAWPRIVRFEDGGAWVEVYAKRSPTNNQ
jgi:4-amino-4-deoxy-L-arabinose transferase-like glycosyltransferase